MDATMLEETVYWTPGELRRAAELIEGSGADLRGQIDGTQAAAELRLIADHLERDGSYVVYRAARRITYRRP
jgi:hypothetical protein